MSESQEIVFTSSAITVRGTFEIWIRDVYGNQSINAAEIIIPLTKQERWIFAKSDKGNIFPIPYSNILSVRNAAADHRAGVYE